MLFKLFSGVESNVPCAVAFVTDVVFWVSTVGLDAVGLVPQLIEAQITYFIVDL